VGDFASLAEGVDRRGRHPETVGDLANTEKVAGTAVDDRERGSPTPAFRTGSETGRRIGANLAYWRRTAEIAMSKGNGRLRARTRRGEGLGTDYESEGRRFESYWAHYE
jgi:hypothetical protein